jgi:threonine aldolase
MSTASLPLSKLCEDYPLTPPISIDLSSDTSTRPTAGMRKAMAEAVVGDEQSFEDPSTNLLCERVAEMLGKEAALLMPTGIMSNNTALLTHCRPGDDIICSSDAHIIGSEGGAPAALGGISITPIDTEKGIYTVDELKARIRPKKARAPKSRLVHIEQTTNKGGGAVWPLATVAEISACAHEHGLSVHMDGARLLNASVASGVAMHQFADHCDSVWIDLSKGLGCPVGSVIAGTQGFIDDVWVWKHRLGGAMRQSGVLAAAGLYALDHHIERIAEDHENAQLLANAIEEMQGLRLDPGPVETNLVFFDVSESGQTAAEIISKLLQTGIRMGATSDMRIRAVTHLDISKDDVQKAIDALRHITQN